MLGRHVRPYTETRQPIRPKDPAVPRGGKCCKAYPGLGNRSMFYPGSSVGSTITVPGEELRIPGIDWPNAHIIPVYIRIVEVSQARKDTNSSSTKVRVAQGGVGSSNTKNTIKTSLAARR